MITFKSGGDAKSLMERVSKVDSGQAKGKVGLLAACSTHDDNKLVSFIFW
ncbi:hypothetical protein SLEP1_g17567 [Rubroshorea leprosula]|uniref:Uncharacterized protein n=1 Tax=Rubroshorea leprosula TaxID=152421 RepID=A0AAV5J090_9ROSI|nr:hypothetical protein SLEP1_g17567 [Rubroshorea leprosula]